MEFLLVIIILGISLFVGLLLSEKQKRKLDALNGLCTGISELRLRLKFNRSSILELTGELAKRDDAAGQFWKEMNVKLSAGQSVADSAAESAAVTLLFCGEEIVDLLSDSFALFGTADADTELKRLELAGLKLGKITEAFAIDCPKQIKLTKTIAALGGAAFALMIL